MVSQKLRRPKQDLSGRGLEHHDLLAARSCRAQGGKRARPHSSAHPKSSYERYLALARAAAASGDAVEYENYLQHADHYYRLSKDKTA